ncbi:MAG: LamG-like jellyroll fold domain-containing protein, partial [Planctomycetota bacterium]
MPKFMKISLYTLVLTVYLAGSPVESLRTVSAVCPLGDLSGNCEVDLPDLLFFAGQWLDTDPLGEDLVAHWKLDGNAADPVGGNHGTVHGNPVWIVGQLDGALGLDGSGDYVDCGNDGSLNLTNNFSISAWFNLDNTGPVLLICKGNVPAWESGGAYTILCIPSNGILAFYVRDSSNTEYAYAIAATPLNEWTHVVGTFSDGNIIIYKDGVLGESTGLGAPAIHSNDEPLAIGADGDGGMPFDGRLDDVRIYDRVLTEAEAQELTNLGMPDPNCADLDGDGSVNLSDFTLLAENWHEEGNPLVINELMASNSSGSDINDLQGDHDDWLEIYNTGNIAVDIGGMYLTDNLSNPTKCWIPDDSPADTTIGPYGHLLIWADEDSEDGPLHVEFKLSSGGDEIGLFDTDGNTLVDSIIFDDQVTDISYGRYPDSGYTWRFMGFPTPEAQNNAGYLGQVADTEFSHNRGFYVEDFNVTITCDTPGATIRYTMNGSTPTEWQGNTCVTGYAIPIEGTTCLRAAAFKPGWLPSIGKTHTYLFNASETIKSLPVVSLVGGEGATFYEPDGVMAIVGGYYSGGVWVSDGPGSYNNPMQRGIAYERPVSFELIKSEDNTGLQINCGIRVHGSNWMRPRYRRCDGYWTGDCKFSFRLYFRGEYGESRLEYPLFPFEVERFKSIVLRGGHNDRVNPFIKDELMRRLHMDMGHVASGGMMANLFINGEYKGYFNPCEHIKEEFCQEWYRSDESWDVMTMNGIRDGDTVAWDDMVNYARNHDLSDNAHYQEVGRRLDIPAFADYLILQLWSGNWDWPQNNWAAAGERSEEGIWRFFIWDAEGAMFSNRLNTVYFDRLNSQNNANGWLYRALKPNVDFRQLFADRIYKHFYNDGALAAANIEMRFLELADEVSGIIPNIDTYVIDTWVPQRWDVIFSAFAQQGLYPNVDAPVFNQHGGQVPSGFDLTMSGSSGTIWYTIDGNDPRLPAVDPPPGTSTTLVTEDAAKRVLVPTGDIGDD